jgi:hypothetical protein
MLRPNPSTLRSKLSGLLPEALETLLSFYSD